MQTEKATVKTEAVFSDDRTHRYLLRKEWETKKPKATIIMTNPSTADMLTLDYTTLYIMNNIVKLDFGAIDIVNLTSKMTTKLNVKEDLDMKAETENIEHIVKSSEKSDKIIVAWGKLGENNKAVRDAQDTLIARLQPFKDKLFVIANESGEAGFHPLAPQIRFSWVLQKYEHPKAPEVKPASVKTATSKSAAPKAAMPMTAMQSKIAEGNPVSSAPSTPAATEPVKKE